mmetsp:Transcript_455/g.1533  ORF Transcript_455/g.1533 Transcript_455/m.1533 type:complete len:253 (-) Transcript_455:258-1016(-)
MALTAAGLLVPNLTQKCYEVVRQPPGVHARLNATLHAAMAQGQQLEGPIDQISGPRPQFLPLESTMLQELLDQMLPYHQAWAGGIELEAAIAYGLRVYGPGNWLTMHFDKHDTHIISSILHVDRDTDEPWPIVIEGYDGKTVEVDLKPGEMLFYESAKCMHGRPRPLKGRFYTSLFMHYHPKDWQLPKKEIIDFIDKNRLWQTPLPADASLPAMRIKGTGFYEPDCHENWCSRGTAGQAAAVPEAAGSEREL